MERNTLTFTDQLRRLIETSGLSRYRFAQESGIDETTLCRFVHGERCLSERNLDKLGDYLRLRIVSGRDKRPGTKKR
jgi:predicted transcriptional regulator